jgi:hypothetical protein
MLEPNMVIWLFFKKKNQYQIQNYLTRKKEFKKKN